MGESPFRGPGNLLTLSDNSGDSLISRVRGVTKIADAGPAAYRAVHMALPFEDETLAVAREMMSSVLMPVNRCAGSDLVPSTQVSLSTTPAAPAIDLNYGSGVFTLNNAKIALNPVTPGATTYNPVLGAVEALTVPWMMRGRYRFNAATFGGGGTFCVFMSLDGSSVGGGGSGHAIQVMSTGTSSSTQVYLWLFNAAFPSGVQFNMGADFVLGGSATNPGIPVNQFFTMSLWFDMVSLRWAINDQFNPTNVLSVPNFDAFPSDAVAAVCSNDNGTGTNFKVDAFAFASAASL